LTPQRNVADCKPKMNVFSHSLDLLFLAQFTAAIGKGASIIQLVLLVVSFCGIGAGIVGGMTGRDIGHVKMVLIIGVLAGLAWYYTIAVFQAGGAATIPQLQAVN